MMDEGGKRERWGGGGGGGGEGKRERERDRDRERYKCIHTCTHTHMYFDEMVMFSFKWILSFFICSILNVFVHTAYIPSKQ